MSKENVLYVAARVAALSAAIVASGAGAAWMALRGPDWKWWLAGLGSVVAWYSVVAIARDLIRVLKFCGRWMGANSRKEIGDRE